MLHFRYFSIFLYLLLSLTNSNLVAEKAQEEKNPKYFSKPVKTNEGFDLIVDERDGCVSSFIKTNGHWENFTGLVLKSLIKPNSKVLHLGSHIGYFDIFIASLLIDSGKIITLEPSPEMYAILTENIKINGMNNKIIAINKAASSKKERLNCVFDFSNTGGAFVEDLDSKKKDAARVFEVQAITLDEEFADEGKFDLLFMDIEGYEYKALQGSAKLLEKNPKMMILLEVSADMLNRAGSSIDDIVKFARNKYNCFGLYEYHHRLEKISPDDINEFSKLEMSTNLLLVPKDLKFDYREVNKAVEDILTKEYSASLSEGFDFSKEGIPSFIKKIEGLSEREHWGRWSDAQLNRNIKFEFKKALPSSFLLKLDGSAFDKNTGEHMDIDICGKTYKIKLEQNFSASIKVDLNKGDKCFHIDMMPPYPIKGNRSIAVGLRKMALIG